MAVGGMSMTMPMYFTNSRKVTLWFEGWESRTDFDYFGQLFVVASMAFVCEAIVSLRAELSKPIGHMYEELSGVSEIRRHMTLRLVNFLRAFLYCLHLTFGYFLMLAAMTYNVGIFVAIIVGYTFGYCLLRNHPVKGPAGEEVGDHCLSN